jgi:hypothetical protein
MIVARTVVDPATGTRKTVYEERVYGADQNTDNPSTPKFTDSLPEDKNPPATTKEVRETEARKADMH